MLTRHHKHLWPSSKQWNCHLNWHHTQACLAEEKTTLHQNMIWRKELKPDSKAEKRCVQCKVDGSQNVFTKWVCLGCGYVPLCNPKWKRNVHHNCFQKCHAAKTRSVLQGQCEIEKNLKKLIDWSFVYWKKLACLLLTTKKGTCKILFFMSLWQNNG